MVFPVDCMKRAPSLNRKILTSLNGDVMIVEAMCPDDTGYLESRVRFIIGLEISLGLACKTVFDYA